MLAARAAGIICVDGVFNAFKDDAGLNAECAQGRALGMDGKTLIHPAQIDIANAVFAPSEDQIDLAVRRVDGVIQSLVATREPSLRPQRLILRLLDEEARPDGWYGFEAHIAPGRRVRRY